MTDTPTRHRHRAAWLLATIISTIAAHASVTAAQAPSGTIQQGPAARAAARKPGGRVLAIVAIDGNFKYKNTDAVVLRRATVQPHDVILIRTGKASPEQIAEAVDLLQALRARQGDVPTADALIRVPPPGPVRAHAREASDWAGILREIRPSDLPGVGEVAHLGLWLPHRNVRVTSAR
jgi:hypothetical protein